MLSHKNPSENNIYIFEQKEPRFELRCSSDVIHIRTCSDSCAALMNLIQYVASYGDLLPPAEPEPKNSSTSQRTKVSSDTRAAFVLQYVTEGTCADLNICSSGWVSMSAHISNPFSGWYWAADVAGFDEWSDGGDWRPAHIRVAAER